MESESLGAHYQKQTFYVIAGTGLLILVGFSIVEYIENHLAAMWTDVAIALIVAGSLLLLRFGNDDQLAYRLGCWGAAIGLLCLVLTGDGLLYYQLAFPLLAFYFLGRREGVVLVGIYFVGLTGLMSASELGFGNVYRTGNTVRFLVGCFFVAVVGWSYEKIAGAVPCDPGDQERKAPARKEAIAGGFEPGQGERRQVGTNPHRTEKSVPTHANGFLKIWMRASLSSITRAAGYSTTPVRNGLAVWERCLPNPLNGRKRTAFSVPTRNLIFQRMRTPWYVPFGASR